MTYDHITVVKSALFLVGGIHLASYKKLHLSFPNDARLVEVLVLAGQKLML